MAEAFGARHLRSLAGGPAAARNVAMRAATAPYLAFLDDDDSRLPAHVRGQLELLESRPELEAVVGQVQCTDVDRRPFGAPWPAKAPANGDLFLMMSGIFADPGDRRARARAPQRGRVRRIADR